MSSTLPLLSLPQELRDLIYAHVVPETLPWPSEFYETQCEATNPTPSPLSGCEIPVSVQRDQPRISYSTDPPRPTWYSLLLCCRQTNTDLQTYWATTTFRSHLTGDRTPTYPTLGLALSCSGAAASKASWSALPCQPTTAKTLKIDVALSNIWDVDIQSTIPGRDNKILASVFDILKRYCVNGPHLLRSSPLEKPLYLDTLILDVGPEEASVGMSCYYGEPGLQLAEVYRVLLTWAGRMCRSGLLWSHVGKMVVRTRTDEDEWNEKTMSVTGDVWDEEDFMIMGSLGYAW